MKLLTIAKQFFGLSNDKVTVNLPDRTRYNSLIKYPIFRQHLRKISIEEDDQNSYYTGMLNSISEHGCGSIPMLLGDHSNPNVNNAVEDAWYNWCVNNGIGTAIRQIRRAAARTGVGIGIPYIMNNSIDQIPLGIKPLSVMDLSTPYDMMNDAHTIDGITYDNNWDIEAIHVKSGIFKTKTYESKDILIWYKKTREDQYIGMPECGPAFCLFPSVRRFMDAIVRSEELNQSIAMMVELDPLVYKVEDASVVPSGKFEYEPGMIPTLPPGMKLVAHSAGPRSAERVQYIELVIGAAARCINMPKTLALGDSSGSNMSVASYDVQPWKNRVKIDRIDYEPVPRKIFAMWASLAELKENYLPAPVRSQLSKLTFKFNYDYVFEHPDPNKNAAARMTDLITGSTTLYNIYSERGKNARREIEREATLLRIDPQDLIDSFIVGRSPAALTIIKDVPGANDNGS